METTVRTASARNSSPPAPWLASVSAPAGFSSRSSRNSRRGLLAPVLGDELHLARGDEGALHAQRARAPERVEEHVARAEQALGAALVEDHARVGLRGHGEGDARGDVRLDHAGDDVHGRALRGDHEVDARAAPELPETDHGILDLRRRHHHQIGELVDDDHDVRQRLLAELLELLVEVADVLRAPVAGHDLVAPVHLAADVVEHVARLLHVRDHGRQQVRDAVEVRELDLLRVDHDHPHLIGRGAQQDRADQAR